MRWLLLLVVAAACAKPATCPVVTPLAGAQRQPFLWRVEKAGTVVWLYGTIHAAGIDAVPRVALDALAAAPRLVTELGDEKVDPDVFRKHARIASGPGIDHQLPSDDWYDLRDALVPKRIKEDDLRRAAPWYAMSLLTQHRSPTSGPSMDSQLVARVEGSKPIAALETWDAQLGLLASHVKLADLQEAIHASGSMHCDLGRMRTLYDAGDTDSMMALLVVPRTAQIMLYPRNRAWLPKLEAYFTKGGAFVAVGLGHLLGPQGLPALFEQAGYTVQRVPR